MTNGGLAGLTPSIGACDRMVPWSGTQRLEINAWAGGTILMTDRVRGLGTSGVPG
jgi:hypothetical protein